MTLADEMIIEKRIEHELGVKEGIAQGITQGITQGKLDAAKGMKVKNIPVEDIVEITGLSMDQIEKL